MRDTTDTINPCTVTAVTLNRAVAITSIVAVLTGMLIYTAAEFFLSPPEDASEFLTHHLLHALLIAVMVWWILSFLLTKKIVGPVREIFRHLYHVGSGRLEHLELESRIQEIRTVVGGINLLVNRLKEAPDHHGLKKACEDLAKLRIDLTPVVETAEDDGEKFVPIMRDLRALEADLLSVVRAETDPNFPIKLLPSQEI